MDDSWYDTAQICMNGHVITTSARDSHSRRADYCSECGEKTILACPACSKAIRGYYHIPGVIYSGKDYRPPAFCHSCGSRYPWTERKISALKQLAHDQKSLNRKERTLLEESLDDIVRNTPNAIASAERFKYLVAKAGKSAADAFRQLLVDIASEVVVKKIWGG